MPCSAVELMKNTVSSLTCSPMSYRAVFGRKISGARYYKTSFSQTLFLVFPYALFKNGFIGHSRVLQRTYTVMYGMECAVEASQMRLGLWLTWEALCMVGEGECMVKLLYRCTIIVKAIIIHKLCTHLLD